MGYIRWSHAEVGVKVGILNPSASGWEDEAEGKVSHDQRLDGPGQLPPTLVGIHGSPLPGQQVRLQR